MMRRFFYAVAVLLILGVSSAYAEGFKVGYVDLVKALNESDAGKKAKTDLEFIIKSKQNILDEKGKTIEKLKGDLDKQVSVLSVEARRNKEDEMERLIREYQRLVSDSQNELKKKEGDITGEIIRELREIIEKIGQEEGYSMIFENADGGIIFSKKEYDLTASIIKKYNEIRAAKTKK